MGLGREEREDEGVDVEAGKRVCGASAGILDSERSIRRSERLMMEPEWSGKWASDCS